MKNRYKIMGLLAGISFLIQPFTACAYTKTESIYANLNANGVVQKSSVSVQLSELEEGDIIDYSYLESITNTNGNEKFSKDSQKLTWKSTGKDIFYKGKIENSLPISVSVEYYLNGESISTKELTNKSGDVEIHYLFHNSSYDSATQMYTPFVVTMISSFDNSRYENINILNGKVVNTGTRSMGIALASPGLYESTGLTDFQSLDEIVVTYHTEKFRLNDVYFVLTPKLLEEADVSFFDKTSNLSQSLRTLQDGMNALQEGSNQLVEGAGQVDNGLSSLNEGIKSALDGASIIRDGISELAEGSSSITSMPYLVDTLYKKYQENNQLLMEITTGVTEQQLKDGIDNASMEKTNLENQLQQVNAMIAVLESSDGSEEVSVQLEQLYSAKAQLEAGISQYAKGISDAQANLSSLALAPAKISGANEVISQVLCGILGVSSIDQVNDSVIDLFHQKIDAFSTGVEALQAGSNQLTGGLNALYEGSNSLKEGTSLLSDGSIQLEEGIQKINEEGISTLSNYGTKISNYSYKIKKLIELSKNYKGFSSDNVDETIFIYKLGK